MHVSILGVWPTMATFASATLLDNCLAATGATLAYDSGSAYANLLTPSTLEFDYDPQVSVIPSSVLQVARTVKCVSAEKGQTKLTIMSEGHNYAAYSFSGDIVILSNNITGIWIRH